MNNAKPRRIRCIRWSRDGHPEAGHFLVVVGRRGRTSTAYRIEAVIPPGPRAKCLFAMDVRRVSVEAIPEGSFIYEWQWEVRLARASQARFAPVAD